MIWALVALAVGVGSLLTAVLYVLISMAWWRYETHYDAYFKKPVAERRAYKARVARRGRSALRLLRDAPRWVFPQPSTRAYSGVHIPTMVCPRRQVERAVTYEPDAGDVLVATQMKCGTTWVQQMVYEVLMRGHGDLGDDGHGHLYSISPWIESAGAVRLEDAPRIGPEQRRIIKTHLPASLCPYSETARYVYMIRHPVACFSSTVDFTQLIAGPFALDRPAALDWYCSDEMWWGSWATHVEGWWRWAQARSNVLFLHFEHALDDLGAAVDQIATLLGVELLPAERAAVVEKSDYTFMKANEEQFEMAAPTFFSEGGTFFVRGAGERSRGAGPAERERIFAFCRDALEGGSYPLAHYYPDAMQRSTSGPRVD